MGNVICLANATNKGNVIHWSLIKYKKVTYSVLATKLYTMVYRYDIRVVIKVMLEKILGSAIPPILYINLKFLYDCWSN